VIAIMECFTSTLGQSMCRPDDGVGDDAVFHEIASRADDDGPLSLTPGPTVQLCDDHRPINRAEGVRDFRFDHLPPASVRIVLAAFTVKRSRWT